MDDLLEDTCKKCNCSIPAIDMQRLHHAREILSRAQLQEIFTPILGPDAIVLDDNVMPIEMTIVPNTNAQTSCIYDDAEFVEEEDGYMREVCHDMVPHELVNDNNVWHGYFKGFEILNDVDAADVNQNNKCIELTKNASDQDIEKYLRAGVRCFVIDLFTGTNADNQNAIVHLRETEIKISKEIGFPVTSTLFAKLSPRFQYTGLVEPSEHSHAAALYKNDLITLTVDKYWSTCGSKKCIYVNAQNLLGDVKLCDFILIGQDIQLTVKEIKVNCLQCKVVQGGTLESRLPVLFPAHCNKYRISVEELENITFAKELNINVIVSYIAGSQEYFDNLQKVLELLQAEKMRLFARIELNTIRGCNDEMHWAAECYDGFIIELKTDREKSEPEVMQLCPASDDFLKRVFELEKPIIFDPSAIAAKRLLVHPEHYKHIFYYPDKYFCSKDSFYFNCLRDSLAGHLPELELSQWPYCDPSWTGSNSLARSCVAASYEMNAKAIIVCSLTAYMAVKIAHFRPKAPIILITRMQSAVNFVMLFHNIVMLHFRGSPKESHYRSVYLQALFGLLYAKNRNIVGQDDNVIFVYGQEPKSTEFSDKYVTYKFDGKNFAEHLDKILFT